MEGIFKDPADGASISQLARQARLTPRAVSIEVSRLEGAGLVSVEALGAAYIVRPRVEHPAVGPLQALLGATAPTPVSPAQRDIVRHSLAAHGAPLFGDSAARPLPINEALLGGLSLARTDGTVLLILPGVLSRKFADIDWGALQESARRQKLKAELGLLLDLTAEVARMPHLRAFAEGLADGRRRVIRHLPTSQGVYERKLAEMRSPASVARWNLRMNLTNEAFRSALNDGPPASRSDVVAFLRAVDDKLTEPVEATFVGNLALGLLYSSPHATARFEVAAVEGVGFWEAGEQTQALPRTVKLLPTSVRDAPAEWQARRVPLECVELRRIRLFVPERHDLALMGLASGLTPDLQAAEDIHRSTPLRLGVLLSRYFEMDEARSTSPNCFRLAFLALLERLFGSETAERTAEGLGNSAPENA